MRISTHGTQIIATDGIHARRDASADQAFSSMCQKGMIADLLLPVLLNGKKQFLTYTQKILTSGLGPIPVIRLKQSGAPREGQIIALDVPFPRSTCGTAMQVNHVMPLSF